MNEANKNSEIYFSLLTVVNILFLILCQRGQRR